MFSTSTGYVGNKPIFVNEQELSISPELEKIYLGFLEVNSFEKVRQDYGIFINDKGEYLVGDDDELWEIPEGFELYLEMEEVHCPTFTWRNVQLGVYKGKRVVIEQCASPLIVFWVG